MQRTTSPEAIVGILLAAGKGTRFDPSGRRNKLEQRLLDGETVAVISAKNLLAALPRVIAVVRPENESLAVRLQDAGCSITVCPHAEGGMAASLVHALSQVRDAHGWVIALADMPYVRPSTVDALADAVVKGADIAVPCSLARRGNPVAFGRAHLNELLQLRGDEGARRLLRRYPVAEIAVDDDGILRDIDTPEDLRLPD